MKVKVVAGLVAVLGLAAAGVFFMLGGDSDGAAAQSDVEKVLRDERLTPRQARRQSIRRLIGRLREAISRADRPLEKKVLRLQVRALKRDLWRLNNRGPCTAHGIKGTAGDDVFRGTRERDVFRAAGGDDRARGKRGPDKLCGYRGRDRLLGDKGRDVLRGGPGNDVLRAGTGFDFIKDIVVGGPGRDFCQNVSNNDESRECESVSIP